VRTVEITESHHLALAERPLPEPVGNQVRVEVGFCGICGTDLHLVDALPAGSVLGHELAGTISAVGPDVEGWSVGDEAAVLIYVNCGKCRYCLSGSENQCVEAGQHDHVIGVQLPGGYSQAVIADASALFRLPEGATVRHGALAEPVSIGVRAAATVDVPLSDAVLVIGAGPIGLFSALALRAKGHEQVFVVERNPIRAEAATRLGFATLAAEDLPGQLWDRGIGAPGAVVECAAAPAAAKAALGVLRRQGQLVLVGLPSGEVSFDAETLVINEIQVRGSAGCSRADFQRALELLASGAIPIDDVVTAIADLGEADAMFAQLLDPTTRHVKVLLQP
jgi:(R,R)-butanediol dehydrogenase / meso-butanediol dehydrogenase / diacetyl reductase